jgi:hypothetical protein
MVREILVKEFYKAGTKPGITEAVLHQIRGLTTVERQKLVNATFFQ